MSQEIVDTERERVPNSYVQSCSECCRERGPDGKPNTAGFLQQQRFTTVIENTHGRLELLDCSQCPVYQATFHRPAETADNKRFYWKNSGKMLTENDLQKLLLDGDDPTLYCDIK